MSGREPYSVQIRPIDTAAEWFLKGANIGTLYSALYFSLCLAKVDNPRGGLSLIPYTFHLVRYTAVQMLTVGGTIGTMFFLSTALWHGRNKNDGFNYGIGGGIAVLLWHRAWDIPRKNLLASSITLGILMGVIGHYVIKDRYLD